MSTFRFFQRALSELPYSTFTTMSDDGYGGGGDYDYDQSG